MTTVPPPLICDFASSCCGCDSRNGYLTQRDAVSRLRGTRRCASAEAIECRTRSRHRLETLEQRPRVERAQRRTGVPHQRLHRTVDVFLGSEDRAAEHAALAVDVLGARVHDRRRRRDRGCAAAAGSRRRCPAPPLHRQRARAPTPAGRRRGSASGWTASRRTPRGRHRQRLLPTASRSSPSTKTVSTPQRGRISLHTTKHEPNRLRAATSRSPARAARPSAVNTADIPLAVAKQASAPSSRRSRSSNIFDRRVAVPGVDEVVDLAGERLLGGRCGLVDESGVQVHRLGGLLEAGPHECRRARRGCRDRTSSGSGFAEMRRPEEWPLTDCRHGRPMARQPTRTAMSVGARSHPRTRRERCTTGRCPPRSRPRRHRSSAVRSDTGRSPDAPPGRRRRCRPRAAGRRSRRCAHRRDSSPIR